MNLSGDPTTAASTGRLFAKTIDSSIELNYMDQAGNVTQLTDFSFKTDANPGSIFIPGNILMQYGSESKTDTANVYTITFPKTFSTVYTIQANILSASAGIAEIITVVTLTTTLSTLKVYNTSGTIQSGAKIFNWIAIGKAN